MQGKKLSRIIVRTAFLLVSVLLVFAGPLPQWLLNIFNRSEGFTAETEILPSSLSRLIPQSSPLISIGSLLSNRYFYLVLLWLLPAALLILSGILKGRLFCRWICPVGTLYSAASRFSAKKYFLKTRLSGYIFWVTFFACLGGLSVFLLLDPLSTFTRTGTLLKGIINPATITAAGLMILFLILSFIQPLIWCSHLCPLGYFLGLLHKTKNVKYKQELNKNKRQFLTGLCIGLPAAFIVPRIFRTERKEKEYPVLPPGALPTGEFSAKCIRCYACVNICPTRAIDAKLPSGTNILEWFQPEVDAASGPCEEFCIRCSEVCPAGAIMPLSLGKKKMTQIGIAKVIRETCLAWSKNEYCMVCDEYCPYNAIKTDRSGSGVPRPVVDPEKCRGCGYCEHECPVKGQPAIKVHGVKAQKILSIPENRADYG